MTRAQRKAIDRLRKKHGGPVVDCGPVFGGKGAIRVRLLSRDIPNDERDRTITPTGIVQEPPS